jgi:hypothetical protein
LNQSTSFQPMRSGAEEIAERDLRAQTDIQKPAPVAGEVEQRRRTESRRHGKAVADVALARPLQFGVNGQDQRRTARSPGALDERLGQPAIAQHVKLEPVGRTAFAGDFLDAAGGHRRQAVRNPSALCCTNSGQFAAPRQQSGEAGRPNHEWRVVSLAEQLHRLVPRRHVGQDPRQQPYTLEIRHVLAQRDLVLGAAVDELEHHFRQALARELSQFFYV